MHTGWLAVGGPLGPCRWHRPAGPRVVVGWPPEYRAWARGQGLLYVTSPALEPPSIRVTHPAETVTLRIVNPPAGAVYLRDPTLRAEFQTLPLRAAADGRAGALTWTLDGRAEAAITVK